MLSKNALVGAILALALPVCPLLSREYHGGSEGQKNVRKSVRSSGSDSSSSSPKLRGQLVELEQTKDQFFSSKNDSFGFYAKNTAVGVGHVQLFESNGDWTGTSAPTNAWSDIASDSTGKYLIATIADETAGGIYYSTDFGEAWYPSTAPADLDWSDVAYDANGDIAIASAGDNAVYVSYDYGYEWTDLYTSSEVTQWTAVAISENGEYMLAASATGYIFFGYDNGESWSESDAPQYEWTGLCMADEGYYAFATSKDGGIYYSTEYGEYWYQSSAGTSLAWSAIACSQEGDYTVAVAQNDGIFISSNYGESYSPTSAPVADWIAVASDTTGWNLAAAASGGYIYTSVDLGVSWQKGTASPAYWTGIASDATGKYLAAAVYDGFIYTCDGCSGASYPTSPPTAISTKSPTYAPSEKPTPEPTAMPSTKQAHTSSASSSSKDDDEDSEVIPFHFENTENAVEFSPGLLVFIVGMAASIVRRQHQHNLGFPHYSLASAALDLALKGLSAGLSVVTLANGNTRRQEYLGWLILVLSRIPSVVAWLLIVAALAAWITPAGDGGDRARSKTSSNNDPSISGSAEDVAAVAAAAASSSSFSREVSRSQSSNWRSNSHSVTVSSGGGGAGSSGQPAKRTLQQVIDNPASFNEHAIRVESHNASGALNTALLSASAGSASGTGTRGTAGTGGGGDGRMAQVVDANSIPLMLMLYKPCLLGMFPTATTATTAAAAAAPAPPGASVAAAYDSSPAAAAGHSNDKVPRPEDELCPIATLRRMSFTVFAAVLFLGLLELSLIKLLPWTRSKNVMTLRGLPSLFVLRCCLYGHLTSITLQAAASAMIYRHYHSSFSATFYLILSVTQLVWTMVNYAFFLRVNKISELGLVMLDNSDFEEVIPPADDGEDEVGKGADCEEIDEAAAGGEQRKSTDSSSAISALTTPTVNNADNAYGLRYETGADSDEEFCDEDDEDDGNEGGESGEGRARRFRTSMQFAKENVEVLVNQLKAIGAQPIRFFPLQQLQQEITELVMQANQGIPFDEAKMVRMDMFLLLIEWKFCSLFSLFACVSLCVCLSLYVCLPRSLMSWL